jgi:hypothetical protein
MASTFARSRSPEMRPLLRRSARFALYLNASEVAVAAGLNRFEQREKVLAKAFRRERAPVAARLEARSVAPESAASLALRAVRGVVGSEALAAVRDEERPRARAEGVRVLAERATTGLERCVLEAVGLSEAASVAAALVAVAAEKAALEAAVTPPPEARAALERAAAKAEQLQAVAAAAAAEKAAVAAAAGSTPPLEAQAALAQASEKAEALQAVATAAEAERVAAAAAAAEPLEVRAALALASARLERLQAAAAAAPLVEAGVRSEVQTARGVRDEPSAVAAVPGFEPDDGTMKYAEFEVAGRRLRFGGRCDGRHADSGDLLEVKNRQSRFRGLPQYEWVQVQVYMLLYDRPRCFFREQLDGRVHEDLVVERDTEALRALLEPTLAEFLALWDRMAADEVYCLGVLRDWPR